MSKSIKLKNNNYWDSKTIVHNGRQLSEILNEVIAEDGYWTPELNTLEGIAPTVEFTAQTGTYKKIGRMVFIDFYIRGKITALNGTNNYAIIKGLPFVPAERWFGQTPLNIGIIYSALNSETNITFDIQQSSNGIRIQGGQGAYAVSWILTPTSYFEIGGSGFYYA